MNRSRSAARRSNGSAPTNSKSTLSPLPMSGCWKSSSASLNCGSVTTHLDSQIGRGWKEFSGIGFESELYEAGLREERNVWCPQVPVKHPTACIAAKHCSQPMQLGKSPQRYQQFRGNVFVLEVVFWAFD